MPDKKNPRVTVTPEAFKALRIEAAIEGISETDLISKLILSHISNETRMILGSAAEREFPARPGDHRDETPEKQKAERSERGPSTVSEKKM